MGLCASQDQQVLKQTFIDAVKTYDNDPTVDNLEEVCVAYTDLTKREDNLTTILAYGLKIVSESVSESQEIKSQEIKSS